MTGPSSVSRSIRATWSGVSLWVGSFGRSSSLGSADVDVGECGEHRGEFGIDGVAHQVLGPPQLRKVARASSVSMYSLTSTIAPSRTWMRNMYWFW